MAQIVERAGKHGTGNLKENKARTRIYVRLRRPFKSEQQRGDLHSAQQQETAT
jgi:hypothetical protein